MLVSLGLVVVLSGCQEEASPPTDSDATETTSGAPATFDADLAAELLAMQEADVADTGTREERQARLAEILDEYGWPGHTLVGKDGSSAAWLIAQHADLDPALQERALELLGEAVERGDASQGDLAYLSDRVAAAKGEAQVYGTQIRCQGGKAKPVVPIADPEEVEALRAEAGLPPLSDYMSEMSAVCAQEG